jgi:threonine synthase
MSTTASTGTMLTSMVCSGCGYVAPAGAARPFRCPNANGKADHVLKRVIDLGRRVDELRRSFIDPEPDPFIRYRRFMHAWNAAMAIGMSDAEYIDLVRRFERSVAAVDGRWFNVTPFERQPKLAAALGLDAEILVKDETSNVSGSHKGRHLMGLMLWLLVMEHRDQELSKSRLAIASCGNAALAAAVVARAAGRPLDVFVPVDASPAVVTKLEELDASVTRCPRKPHVAGDPSYLRFREAVAAGALPFTCQGNENGLVIEGCQTLGFEIVSQLIASEGKLDRIFVQVGGGALASAVIAAFEDAVALRLLAVMPRVHAVQTSSAFPLRRAWDHVVARIAGDASPSEAALAAVGFPGRACEPAEDYECMDNIALRITAAEADEAMRFAVAHRAQFMWPWETVPESIAHGILDDETYDWAAVVRGMLISGGYPIVVSEEQLKRANSMAVKSTGIPVDHTGTSGFAGLLQLQDVGLVDPGESVAVLFTGRRR